MSFIPSKELEEWICSQCKRCVFDSVVYSWFFASPGKVLEVEVQKKGQKHTVTFLHDRYSACDGDTFMIWSIENAALYFYPECENYEDIVP